MDNHTKYGLLAAGAIGLYLVAQKQGLADDMASRIDREFQTKPGFYDKPEERKWSLLTRHDELGVFGSWKYTYILIHKPTSNTIHIQASGFRREEYRQMKVKSEEEIMQTLVWEVYYTASGGDYLQYTLGSPDYHFWGEVTKSDEPQIVLKESKQVFPARKLRVSPKKAWNHIKAEVQGAVLDISKDIFKSL